MENKFQSQVVPVFFDDDHGAVIFNYGTAARYRFPFLLLFVLFADGMTIAPLRNPFDKTAKKNIMNYA